MEDKHLEELHELKQSRKVEAKPSEEMYQMNLTPKKQPELTRSKSTPALLESPSALSRRVSFMSKKVKETLGKVMIGKLFYIILLSDCQLDIAYHVVCISRDDHVTGAMKCDRAYSKSTVRAFVIACSSC